MNLKDVVKLRQEIEKQEKIKKELRVLFKLEEVSQEFVETEIQALSQRRRIIAKQLEFSDYFGCVLTHSIEYKAKRQSKSNDEYQFSDELTLVYPSVLEESDDDHGCLYLNVREIPTIKEWLREHGATDIHEHENELPLFKWDNLRI